jgi:triosephosphate isomerase
MHHGPGAAREVARELVNGLRGKAEGVDVLVIPPFVSIAAVEEIVRESRVALGAQNLHQETKGAFTGEISAPMLAEAGCSHVLVGHSERRHVFGETDATVAAKLKAAVAHGLVPIVCVGELREEREAGRTEEVLRRQLSGALDGDAMPASDELVLAYEPVWAIGTGLTATSEQAQEAHAFLRALLAERYGEGAGSIRIQYGGSVKPDNAAELMANPDVDGLLVGGASLDASSLLSIVRASG